MGDAAAVPMSEDWSLFGPAAQYGLFRWLSWQGPGEITLAGNTPCLQESWLAQTVTLEGIVEMPAPETA